MSKISDACKIIIFLTRLKDDIEADLKPTLNRGDPDGGYWSSIELIFTCTELFGAYYLDKKPSTDTGKKFLETYFGFQNPNPIYKKIPGLLYAICRHGTVHQRKGKKFILIDDQGNKHHFGIVVGKDIDLVNRSDKSTFYWSKDHGGDNQIYTHLVPRQPEKSHKIITQYPEIKLLPISIEQLFFDFIKGIENYLSELKNDEALQKKAIQMREKMDAYSTFLSDNSTINEEHPIFERATHREKRSYIKKDELDYLLNKSS